MLARYEFSRRDGELFASRRGVHASLNVWNPALLWQSLCNNHAVWLHTICVVSTWMSASLWERADWDSLCPCLSFYNRGSLVKMSRGAVSRDRGATLCFIREGHLWLDLYSASDAIHPIKWHHGPQSQHHPRQRKWIKISHQKENNNPALVKCSNSAKILSENGTGIDCT